MPVRYAWRIYPFGVNLFGKRGLLASPFQGDGWDYRSTNFWCN